VHSRRTGCPHPFHSFGLDKTVTTGVVSALNREIRTSGNNGILAQPIRNCVQTDCSINPGEYSSERRRHYRIDHVSSHSYATVLQETRVVRC
jgi:hypothetical protein